MNEVTGGPLPEEEGEPFEIDLENGLCHYPDGHTGEITVMIDRDGYPTMLRSEAYLVICNHPEGGFVDVPLDPEDRQSDRYH